MAHFRKIVGERVYLSPIDENDCEQYVKWLNDFEITDRLGMSGLVTTIKSETDFFEQHAKNGDHIYGICRLENDELIGNIGIENIQNVNRTADVGIFIGDEKYRNNGYGTEALTIACRYAFDRLNLHSLHLSVYDFNKRAIACYKKVGFKEAGRLRENLFCNGRYYDTIIMDILKADLK